MKRFQREEMIDKAFGRLREERYFMLYQTRDGAGYWASNGNTFRGLHELVAHYLKDDLSLQFDNPLLHEITAEVLRRHNASRPLEVRNMIAVREHGLEIT